MSAAATPDPHGGHTDPNPKGFSLVYLIVGLLIVSLTIWALRPLFNGSSSEGGLETAKTVTMSELLAHRTSRTITITAPTYFDFTGVSTFVCSHQEVKVTTSKGSAILRGTKFEGKAVNIFDSENVWLIEPTGEDASITLTKKI